MRRLFENDRLFRTVQYYNGEAAFLLVPFSGAVHLWPAPGGSTQSYATLCSRSRPLRNRRCPRPLAGAMVARPYRSRFFFVLSGQRLRCFLAPAP